MTGNIFLASTAITANEDDGVATVRITRTGDISGTASITYGTNSTTAVAGVDYIENRSTVTFAANQAFVDVPVAIINDGLSESTESFNISLIVADDTSTLLFPRTARIDIIDDENPPPPTPPIPPLVSNYDVTQQTVVSVSIQPISFQWAAAGGNVQQPLMFVASKTGFISVYNSITFAPISTFIDIRIKVNESSDRGLMDIALDPNFSQNGYVYAFYVVDPDGAAANPTGTINAGQDGVGNRYSHVVRFTADPATGYTTVIPGSEKILIGGGGKTFADISGGGAINSIDPVNAGVRASDVDVNGNYNQDYLKVDSNTHVGGSLTFGPDGALYIGVGDGVAANFLDPRGLSVQSVQSLSGKILRVNPETGQGYASNPFAAGQSLDSNQSKVWQMGLRNPFALTFDQNGDLLISDTGWYTYEEVNKGPAGANFGWPFFEGGDLNTLSQTPQYNTLTQAQAFYAAVASGSIVITPPLRAFAHDDNAPGFQFGAVVGSSSIYTGDKYPAALLNSYFLTDVTDSEVYVIGPDASVQYLTQSSGTFVHFAQGPDGYIYYADLNNKIGRFIIVDKPVGNTVLPTFATVGSATAAAGNFSYTVTPDAALQTGAVILQDRIDLSKAFDVTFRVNLGTKDGAGADGMAFVLHNDARGLAAIGAGGGAMGALNIQNGLAIQFDTFQNAGDVNDIANDHTSFINTANETILSPIRDFGNLEDGAFHTVRVTGTGSAVSYSVDGVQVASLSQAAVLQNLGGSPFAYLAFTGATGGLSNTQQVQVTSLSAITASGQTLSTTPGAALPAVSIALSPASATEGDSFVLTATRNGTDLSQATSISYAITGTAANASDLSSPLTGTLTFAANATTATATIVTVQDLISEATDTFTVTASNPVNGTLGVATATASILDNDGIGGVLPTFSTAGSAAAVAGTFKYTVTPDVLSQRGAVTSLDRIDLSKAFDLTFQINLGTKDATGADGMAFVLHNDARGTAAIGSVGGNLGAFDIQNGLAIEFDTYRNTTTGFNDIVNDHTNFINTATKTVLSTIRDLGNIENGAWHTVRVTGTGAAISYSFDGTQVASLAQASLVQNLGGSPYAYIAFTGGTGGTSNLQQVQLTSLSGITDTGKILTTSPGTGPALPAVSFALTPDSVTEGSSFTLTASRTGSDLSQASSVDYTITGAAANVGDISSPLTGTLTFATNATTATRTIATVQDATGEATESFTITASNPVNATTAATVTGSILDDDGVGVLPSFRTVGSAAATTGTFKYTVTPDAALQTGAVTLSDRIDLSKAFDVTFQVNLGTKDAGADGMAFVLHNDARGLASIGAAGGAMGALNINNGLAIQFDTFRNSTDPNDIVNDHTSFINTASEAILSTVTDLGNIEDGAWHTVRVTGTGSAVSYSFDGAQVASLAQTAVLQNLGGSTYAYLAFTGATGGLSNTQQVQLISMDATTESGAHLLAGPYDLLI